MEDHQDEWDVIFRYSNEQAVADGVKIALAPRLYCTTNLALRLAPELGGGIDRLRLAFLVDTWLDMRRIGIYCTPDATRHPEETSAKFLVYEVDGQVVWGIEDGEGLHFILPEDY